VAIRVADADGAQQTPETEARNAWRGNLLFIGGMPVVAPQQGACEQSEKSVFHGWFQAAKAWRDGSRDKNDAWQSSRTSPDPAASVNVAVDHGVRQDGRKVFIRQTSHAACRFLFVFSVAPGRVIIA